MSTDETPTNEAIMKQMESIQEDQRKEFLVGQMENFESLVEEFKGATPTQLAKVKVRRTKHTFDLTVLKRVNG